jgi:hypothetical protein
LNDQGRKIAKPGYFKAEFPENVKISLMIASGTKVAQPSPAAGPGGVSPPVLSPGGTPGQPAGGTPALRDPGEKVPFPLRFSIIGLPLHVFSAFSQPRFRLLQFPPRLTPTAARLFLKDF